MSDDSHDDEAYEADLCRRVSAALRRDRPGVEVGALRPAARRPLRADLPGGDDAGGRWSSRPCPPDRRPVGRHDMLRQARIIEALAPTGVPVPAIVAIDEREPAWFAMQLVAGESLEPVLDDPAVRAGAGRRPDAACRRDPAGPARRTARQGAGRRPSRCRRSTSWTAGPARWRRSRRSCVPDARAAATAARRRRCRRRSTPTLVHGDYRLGNLICRGTEPVALIDWEIWSVGDPRVELGWFLVFADGANFPGVGREVPGLPGAGRARAAYAADGRPVDDLAWFDALGRFKMAAIMGHNLRRHREGRHHDPDQERLPDTIRRLIRPAATGSTERHCRGLRAFRPDARPAGAPAGVHGRARLPRRGGLRRPGRGARPTRTSSRR